MWARRTTGLVTWLLLSLGPHGVAALREGDDAVISASEAEARSCKDSWGRLKDMSSWKVKVRASTAKFVGQGANGCVYTAEEQGGSKVVIKTSKWNNRLALFKDECWALQTIHLSACTHTDGPGAPQDRPTPIALAEQYVPTCLEVGGTADDPYIIQQLAHGEPWEPTGLQVKDQKAVFAQLVEAVFTLHRLGLAHNDMTIGNVYLDKMSSPPRVALIDLGDMTRLSKIPSAYKGNYKRDANAIWERSQALIGCNVGPSQGATKETVQKFVQCVRMKWQESTASSDMERFAAALTKMLSAGVDKTDEQHVEQLYNTKEVQEWLPPHQELYHWTDCQPQSGFAVNVGVNVGTTPHPATTTRSGTVRCLSGSLLAASVVLATAVAHLVL